MSFQGPRGLPGPPGPMGLRGVGDTGAKVRFLSRQWTTNLDVYPFSNFSDASSFLMERRVVCVQG